jgi:hypothetical protein
LPIKGSIEGLKNSYVTVLFSSMISYRSFSEYHEEINNRQTAIKSSGSIRMVDLSNGKNLIE